MVKHIVFFKFGDFPDKRAFIDTLCKMINDLQNKIDEVHHIEAGLNFSKREVAWDIALVSDFRSEEDLEIYRVHPDHMALVEFLEGYEREVAVVDYTY